MKEWSAIFCGQMYGTIHSVSAVGGVNIGGLRS